MKTLARLALVLFMSLALPGSGCTKIDTPVRTAQDERPSGPLLILSETTEILDTQPLVLEAENTAGSGPSWSTDPDGFGFFQPETGERVVYVPPDVAADCAVMVRADDGGGRTCSLALSVIDQGGPPEPGEVLINELAWAGTLASSLDEYIELVSRTQRPLYLCDWRIENAGSGGAALLFSALLEPGGLLLIANYAHDSGKSALTCPAHLVDADLSLSNSRFGPYRLMDWNGTVYDTVGDGESSYPLGENESDTRASMARYTHAGGFAWDPAGWYTEGARVNLAGGSFGTPGAPNSDQPLETGPTGEDALVMITEYRVDVNDDLDTDWVELYVTRSGTLDRVVLTDLDGDDGPLTGEQSMQVEQGSSLLVIWRNPEDAPGEGGILVEGDRIYTDQPYPTGTKDQLVLLCGDAFLDGVCYCADPEDPFDDDEKVMRDNGWVGPPVHGKRASRRTDAQGAYLPGLEAAAWDPEAAPSPGG
jgi:hypothetical protein